MPMWGGITLVLGLIAVVASTNVEGKGACHGQFEECGNGVCALDFSLCFGETFDGCQPGELVCPLSEVCVDANAYTQCPGLNGTHLDWTLTPQERAKLLVAKMTAKEKASQMSNFAIALPKHGVPRFQWLADNLHGVRGTPPMAGDENKSGGRVGRHHDYSILYPTNVTMFPAGPTLGASFNASLLSAVGAAIGIESRALYNAETMSGRRGWVPNPDGSPSLSINGPGLSIYSPNVNLVRDPRWGRNAEVYGECPTHSAILGASFVSGLQGNGKYLLSSATCKHAAVYDVEADRHHHSVSITGRPLFEFHLPALEACASVATQIMCSYNAINGVPACAESRLLDGVFRGHADFDGFVVSDYDAWQDLNDTYGLCDNYACAAAAGLHGGGDMEGGGQVVVHEVPQAIDLGLVSEERVNLAVERIMEVRIKLGTLDPPEMVEYNSLHVEKDVLNREHVELALEAARQGTVLMKNTRDVLPLNPKDLKKMVVVGPAADSASVLLGPYADGQASSEAYGIDHVSTIFGGLREALNDTSVAIEFQAGCADTSCEDTSGFKSALEAANQASAVVVVLNLDQNIEREGVDRTTMSFPDGQMKLLKQLRDAASGGVPFIAILIHGGAVTLPKIWSETDAVLDAFYPGQMGGRAVADLVFGKISPSGRLPFTFYAADGDLPITIEREDPYPFNHSSRGLTYRYYDGLPFLPFGFGLSYTHFLYSNLTYSKNIDSCETLDIEFTITNTGGVEASEVAMVFLSNVDATVPAPKIRLAAFTRVGPMAPGSEKRVKLSVPPSERAVVFEHSEGTPWDATRVVEGGKINFSVGGSLPGYSQVLSGVSEVTSTEPVPLQKCSTLHERET